ncbi:ScbR family autoregulator-binding transcription factor [Streptomyces sp. NPDC050856]|uniref:ScbR family autoregulator-binding transcription factor n=1 Tax=Streptomyces sp. NPDC050856 TaxID=3154939 RepID=UPI003403C6A8
MARQERAVRTRRAILEAAAAVFDERGYEAATIAEILERAGVTKGALYFHFPSKQALAQGVLDEQLAEGGVPPRDSKLQEMVDVGLLLAYRIKREPMLSAGARLSLGPEMRDVFCGGSVPGWIEFTTRLLEAAKAQGELLPHVNPAETAWVFCACWTGAQMYSQALTEREDLEARVTSVYQHIYPSIATPAVLARLDMSPQRAARVVAEVESLRAAEADGVAESARATEPARATAGAPALR